MNYYNEWDSFAAEWLKELIKDGLIPDGEVDSRSIADVSPEDLKGFTQCHFFAGIGGWSRALQIAGWSPDRPVWTGSPPCQSFSTAGKGTGKDDERHLWPVFFNLIRECSPQTVFGEQVAAAIRHGWLDDLQNDFEAEGYASAAVVLPSGSIGAYHKRDRLFFTAKRVADSNNLGHERSAGVGWEAQRGTEHSSEVSMADSGIHGQPRQREMGRPGDTKESGIKEVNRAINASGFGSSRTVMPRKSPWPTPAARDFKGTSGSGRQEKKSHPSDTVPNAAATVPWATPTATDHSRGTKPPRPQDTGIPLTQQVSELKPWATPNTMDHMKQRSDEALARAKQKAGCSNLKDQIPYSGEAQKSSTAETESIAPSQLNPRFSLWLMGYPIEWAYSGERVTPLSPQAAAEIIKAYIA